MSISSLTPAATAPVTVSQPPAVPAHSAGPTQGALPADAVRRAEPVASAATRSDATNGANIAPTSEELQQALEDVQAAIRPVANELTFSIDRDSGRTLIKIVDSQTDELIRQIPSEEMLRIAKALDKLQGLLLKQEA